MLKSYKNKLKKFILEQFNYFVFIFFRKIKEIKICRILFKTYIYKNAKINLTLNLNNL